MPPRSPRCLLKVVAQAARVTLLATAAGTVLPALAQSGAPQRVEVTGSAIKRLDTETALPVRVITRDEIQRVGATTAAEIVAGISATASNLTDGGSIAYGGFRDQMGFNGANLRGLGVSSTLVLLNGRRMANFASPGDAAGVDLNSIPAAAIDRVEILLDGASSLYGSDAIGGVMNFITRKDFNGIVIDALARGTTEGGGGGKRGATLSGGFGQLDRDGFNVFGVLDLQKTSKLNALDRKFISDLKIPERLPDLLSSATFPGNIRLARSQFNVLAGENFSTNGMSVIDTRTINPAAATGCNPPANLYLVDGIGGVDGCTFDYMRDIELYPKTDKSSVFTRGTFNLGAGHTAFAEVSLARSRSYYSGTPNRVDADIDIARVPALAGSALNNLPADDEDRIITVRTRLVEAGLRTSELVSSGQRVVLGTTGVVAGWDYEWGVNHSTSTVSDRDHQGYLNEQMVRDGFADGTLNPFGPSSAAGLALYEAAQIRGEVRRAKGTMTSLDLKASRALMKLDGGDLAVAVGAELRREKQNYHQSAALANDEILGEVSQGPAADFGRSRSVSALFGEVSAPISKQLELTGALRYERYQVSGGAFSPKLGLRYTPSRALLLRASLGAGFRAPSMSDLYRPLTEGSSATLVDPACLAADPDNTVTDCSDIWITNNYSNSKLKPEKSRQFSLGMVFEPVRDLSVSVDYWNVQKSDLISTLGVDVILGNLAKYGNLVNRDSDGVIDSIDLVKQNRGKQKISGLDINLALNRIASPVGTLGLRLNGTLTLQSKQQTGDGDPYVSNLGRFINDGVVQRWRHSLAVDWEQGPFGATLSNSHLSGYKDQFIIGKPDRSVPAYSLWNLSGSWAVTPALKLRANVTNLFDKAPPFSQQAWFFLSGYDPSYTDPRGRSVQFSLSYTYQ